MDLFTKQFFVVWLSINYNFLMEKHILAIEKPGWRSGVLWVCFSSNSGWDSCQCAWQHDIFDIWSFSWVHIWNIWPNQHGNGLTDTPMVFSVPEPNSYGNPVEVGWGGRGAVLLAQQFCTNINSKGMNNCDPGKSYYFLIWKIKIPSTQ